MTRDRETTAGSVVTAAGNVVPAADTVVTAAGSSVVITAAGHVVTTTGSVDTAAGSVASSETARPRQETGLFRQQYGNAYLKTKPTSIPGASQHTYSINNFIYPTNHHNWLICRPTIQYTSATYWFSA